MSTTSSRAESRPGDSDLTTVWLQPAGDGSNYATAQGRCCSADTGLQAERAPGLNPDSRRSMVKA